jgi:hypothetical protein
LYRNFGPRVFDDSHTITNVKTYLHSPTSRITLGDFSSGFPDIAPQTSVESYGYFQIQKIDPAIHPDTTIVLPITIYSQGFPIWQDSIVIDVISGMENDQIHTPYRFTLEQNYSNPFNPTTTIEFVLYKTGFVKLNVSNTLGKEVSTLVLKNLRQGKHTFTFDEKNLASGIYYYQLVAGEYRDVKKMILIR